ncbi:hypothetical protein QEJ31_09680 [Pigmentibacter sp. JX0631]|uniref:hypothetical protein n=1 Tax=Pigmentibacter sp. JX0631 TaxID=2976982 RepID=UPI002468CAB3|nr:hypothetical protein [Pigmentibacter sp. JX0631]WGL58795.1 hypothetical protein QEJ31_09680 [Pigmentibacter sp. JX0631]
MKIITQEDIVKKLNINDLLFELKKSFIYYSEKKIICAPITQTHFSEKNADIHIKSGYLKDDKYYYVKIASGFPDNYLKNISPSQGVIIALNTSTGIPEVLIKDDGFITDTRTALSATLCAKFFASDKIESLGIMGNGIQAYLNAKYLKFIFPELKNLYIYGRNIEKLKNIQQKFVDLGCAVNLTDDPNVVLMNNKIIICTTSSKEPYLFPEHIIPGTVIIALGADDGIKQELSSSVIFQAKNVFVDSLDQCLKYGELSHAVKQKPEIQSKVLELGDIFAKNESYISKAGYTVIDLTGLAAQDIMMSRYILNEL